MNNEEKILLMLEGLVSKVDKIAEQQGRLEEHIVRLEERQVRLEEQLVRLEERQGRLEERQSRLEEDVAYIKQTLAKIETEHGKKLDILFDGYSMVYSVSKEIQSEMAKTKAEQQYHEFLIKWICSKEGYNVQPFTSEKSEQIKAILMS